MTLVLPLLRLQSGAGTLSGSADEMARLGVRRSLRLNDSDLKRARAIPSDVCLLPAGTIPHFDVPEDRAVADANAASAAYRAGVHCLQFRLPLSPAVGDPWPPALFERRLTPHRNQSHPEVESK